MPLDFLLNQGGDAKQGSHFHAANIISTSDSSRINPYFDSPPLGPEEGRVEVNSFSLASSIHIG